MRGTPDNVAYPDDVQKAPPLLTVVGYGMFVGLWYQVGVLVPGVHSWEFVLGGRYTPPEDKDEDEEDPEDEDEDEEDDLNLLG